MVAAARQLVGVHGNTACVPASPGRGLLMVLLVVAFAATGCDTRRGPGEGSSPVSEDGGAPADEQPEVAFTFPAQVARGAIVSDEELSGAHDGVVPGGACALDGQCDSPLRCVADSCAFPSALTGRVEEDTPRVAFLVGEEQVLFHLELAVSRAEQSRGLMHRRSMVDDHGMLFWYDEEQPLRFWMDQTLIPLDMIFVDEAMTVVHVEHEAEPLTRTPRGPRTPSRYVIEIRGGLARAHGIEVGQRVAFDGVDRALAERR